jgi:hypothetical protein
MFVPPMYYSSSAYLDVDILINLVTSVPSGVLQYLVLASPCLATPHPVHAMHAKNSSQMHLTSTSRSRTASRILMGGLMTSLDL